MARLLPPESSSVERVSREVGISVATLERWRAAALANGAVAGNQRWTAAARLEAVIVTAAMDEAARSAWCREQGLYPAELDAWKRDAIVGLEAATVAPELAYVTARYAALAPFGKVADLLSALLPVSGAQNAGTVRNRTMRVGEAVVQPNVTTTAKPATPRSANSVVVGLDGGYVRSRHRQDERHFEVIAGKVIGAQGSQSRFAFARNSPAIASGAFKQALAMAGVTADTPATVLCDGDAGLWRLQREALPNATVVLDWWHAAVRFEHALQAARGLGAAGGGSRTGPCEVALVARALARMPAQTGSATPLGAAYIHTRHDWHRAPGTSPRRAAGLSREKPARAGPLRRPAPEWRTDATGCRIKLHFIPAYCPHLDPIERLWALMHKHVTHNRCHATFADFKAEILTFLREEVTQEMAHLL